MLALVQNMINHMFEGHFLLAQMRWTIYRTEAAALPVFLNLSHWSLHFASVSLKLAPVFNIFNDS